MKKLFISLVALVAVLASCSKSQMIELPGNEQEISFNPYFGKTTLTKGAVVDQAAFEQLTEKDGGAFQVMAFMHTTEVGLGDDNKTYDFDAARINTDADAMYMNEAVWHENEGWKYDGVTYWPDPATKRYLTFCAYAKNTPMYSDDTEYGIDFGDETTEYTYHVSEKVEEHYDLIAAPIQPNLLSNSTTLLNGKVNFTFNHLLSKVGFKVVSNTDNDKIEINIKSLKISGDFYGSGKVDLKSNTAEIIPVVNDTHDEYVLLSNELGYFSAVASTTATDIYVNNGSLVNGKIESGIDAKDVNNSYLMLIPCPSKDVKIEVVYHLTNAKEDQTATVILPETFGEGESAIKGFVAGKQYTFVLSISTTAIDFSATVSGWDNAFVTQTFKLEQTVEESEEGEEN